MPFVLKHKQTAQIATDTLINSYDLPYFGTKYWDSEADALREYVAYLQSHLVDEPSLWEVIEVEDMQMKMFNVKLRNDPLLRLFLNEQGKPIVQPGHL